LNQLVESLRFKYRRLFCAGPSYGGLTLLIANPDIDAASFWDSSFTPGASLWNKELVTHPDGTHTIGWGMSIQVGEAMVREGKALDAKAEELAAVFRAPAQVALAGIGAENLIPTHLYDSLKGKKELIRVAGASHCFYESDTARQLAVHTQRWFEAA
jgi:hypothetical protein